MKILQIKVAGTKNIGHGHVYVRPDGVVARCGGPGMCQACSADLVKLQGELSPQPEAFAQCSAAQAARDHIADLIADLQGEHEVMAGPFDPAAWKLDVPVVHLQALLGCRIPAEIEGQDDDDRMVKITKLIADLERIKEQFGDTCVYVRRGGLSWGAVALNHRDDDKKHGVFDLQAQHDRDMLQRAEQAERLIKARNEAEQKLAQTVSLVEGLLSWLDQRIGEASKKQREAYELPGSGNHVQGERWHARQIALGDVRHHISKSIPSTVRGSDV